MSFVSGSTPFGIFDTDPQFAAEADRLVDFTRKKLGAPVMSVHLSSSQIYASFEEACLEYSAILNQYQAKSVLTQFLGTPTGSLSGSEQTYAARTLEFERKMAEAYSAEVDLNSSQPEFTASIQLTTGVQAYDLQALLSGTGPLTGSNADARIRVRKLHHHDPFLNFRMFGTTSAVNYLNNQFGFESFTPETIFYLLPIWEDILRGMQFETSNRIRRSNYSYEYHNNVLTLYPVPTQNLPLYLTYTLPPDPTNPNGPGDSSFRGVANLANVPFGNITYSNLNSIGRQWIRRFAFALAKEVEGQIRGKMSSIPIPNGELTLNGPELINDARADQETLRNELKQILDELTYDKLAARDAEMASALQQTLREIPLGIWIG